MSQKPQKEEKVAAPESREIYPVLTRTLGWKEERQEVESHLPALELPSHSPEETFWPPEQMLLKW